jgi:hypothetical protein
MLTRANGASFRSSLFRGQDDEYDRASQLLAATRKDAATNAVQKQYTYRYVLAGNRTLERLTVR